MSIIMVSPRYTPDAEPTSAEGQTLDPGIRDLLDHIAVELAEEYVHLMEAAADAESSARLASLHATSPGDAQS